MKWLFIFSSIVIPIFMLLLHKKWFSWKHIFNLLAIIAFLIFGNISAMAVYEIIRDDEVFMTTIHGIFLNPYFLISGAYIGIYILYKLLQITVRKEEK